MNIYRSKLLLFQPEKALYGPEISVVPTWPSADLGMLSVGLKGLFVDMRDFCHSENAICHFESARFGLERPYFSLRKPLACLTWSSCGLKRLYVGLTGPSAGLSRPRTA